MARRSSLLLLAAVVVGLCAGLAGFSLGSAPSDGFAVFAPAELRASDTSSETPPALKRGGFAMAAVESSRRKLRAPQRPATQSLILTGRSMADAPAQSDSFQPSSEPTMEAGRPTRPFLARGPPVWTLA